MPFKAATFAYILHCLKRGINGKSSPGTRAQDRAKDLCAGQASASESWFVVGQVHGSGL
jgi:hypothetical protein